VFYYFIYLNFLINDKHYDYSSNVKKLNYQNDFKNLGIYRVINLVIHNLFLKNYWILCYSNVKTDISL